jgi:hypothetical protein
MHGGVGGIWRDPENGELGIIGLQQTDSLTIHTDPSRNKIGNQREGVTVAFYPRDITPPFKPLKELLEKGEFPGRKSEMFEQVRRAERWRIQPLKGGQDFLFPVPGGSCLSGKVFSQRLSWTFSVIDSRPGLRRTEMGHCSFA